MGLSQWIWAVIALACGILFGEIAGRATRRAIAASRRYPSLAEWSASIGKFVFWTATAVGLVLSIAILDIETLSDFEDQLVDELPRFLLAFVWVIIGYAAAVAISAIVGQSARKATGVRQPTLERALRTVVMVAAVAAALSQAGIGSGMLILVVALVVGTPCVTVILLSGLGGKEVAAELAAGRTLRHHVRPGVRIRVGSIDGTVLALHSTAVEVESERGDRVHIPNRTLLSGGFTVLQGN